MGRKKKIEKKQENENSSVSVLGDKTQTTQPEKKLADWQKKAPHHIDESIPAAKEITRIKTGITKAENDPFARAKLNSEKAKVEDEYQKQVKEFFFKKPIFVGGNESHRKMRTFNIGENTAKDKELNKEKIVDASLKNNPENNSENNKQ